MSYNTGKPKKTKRLYYRFEHVKLTDLPEDIEWLKVATDKKIATEAINKYPYWFMRGTKDYLRRTKELGKAN